MTIERIESLSDPRLEPYRHLRTSNLTRFSGRFIAESRPLVQRLLASSLRVESVLVDENDLDEGREWLPDDLPILVVPTAMIPELIGFHFHRGFLACGHRPPAKPWDSKSWGGAGGNPPADWTGVLLVGVQDPENMGSILRTCSALGIQDILIGPECVDPFARRVLRVSMGNAFKLSFYEVANPSATLDSIRNLGVESLAACLSPTSIELTEWHRSRPALVVLGNEAHGLPPEVIAGSDQGIRIDMDLGTDSLNVSVAAAILLHYVCRLGR